MGPPSVPKPMDLLCPQTAVCVCAERLWNGAGALRARQHSVQVSKKRLLVEAGARLPLYPRINDERREMRRHQPGRRAS